MLLLLQKEKTDVYRIFIFFFKNTIMSWILKRSQKTWLFVSQMKDLEEDLLESLRLANGHPQRLALMQANPPAARESRFLVR